MDLTDEQWEIVKPLIPIPTPDPLGRGRPRVDDRAIQDGILWVMRTGTPWNDISDRYPPYQTNLAITLECSNQQSRRLASCEPSA